MLNINFTQHIYYFLITSSSFLSKNIIFLGGFKLKLVITWAGVTTSRPVTNQHYGLEKGSTYDIKNKNITETPINLTWSSVLVSTFSLSSMWQHRDDGRLWKDNGGDSRDLQDRPVDSSRPRSSPPFSFQRRPTQVWGSPASGPFWHTLHGQTGPPSISSWPLWHRDIGQGQPCSPQDLWTCSCWISGEIFLLSAGLWDWRIKFVKNVLFLLWKVNDNTSLISWKGLPAVNLYRRTFTLSILLIFHFPRNTVSIKKNLFPAGFEPATLSVWSTRDNRYTKETCWLTRT